MVTQGSSGRRPALMFLPILAVVLAGFLASGSLVVIPANTEEVQVSDTPQPPATWQQIDSLISTQKFQEALQLVEQLRRLAQAAGNRDEWTRALIKEVQLRTGLHGVETAVRFLKEQPWPDGQLQRIALNLFYARALVNYYRSYSWEINKRERVESGAAVDLKSWTREQLYAEAQKAYEETWQQRAALGREPVDRLAEYLDANNYPAAIRGTLRDALSYLYVELLADTSFWRPEESNELYRLDLKVLISDGEAVQPALFPFAALHPLAKIAAILKDLQTWHASGGRREASLEARLELLRRLHASFSQRDDRDAILQTLEKTLPGFRGVAWWAMGQALRAEFVREQDQSGKLARARAIAEEGYRAYPDSLGGKRCFHIFKSIEAPDFSVTSMSADGFGKRSLEVAHRNLAALYFRAYPLDLEQRLFRARDRNLLPDQQELSRLVQTREFAVQWRVDLPATPDYETHRTFVTPPIERPGSYMIVASAQEDFSNDEGNRVVAAHLILSDLVLTILNPSPSAMEVRTVSGETGKPLAGVTVALYRYDWQRGHQKMVERAGDAEGLVNFANREFPRNFSYFLFARTGSHVALYANSLYFYEPQEAKERTASLIYTDRSVYRPLQKILWKVLVYKGRRDKAQFRASASSPVSLSLLDPNGQKVGEQVVTTNSFGTAAGEFSIPAGRPLGRWLIQSSLNGQAPLTVEEYKRPTFEVTIKDPVSALRLNREATLAGEVKYYFGLPVVNGKVQWRVTREPVYPWWWDWYGRGDSRQVTKQTVAAGTAPLELDGTFSLTFTPEVDERQAAGSKDITYRYGITADVTDEGGETRSASKTFRLGFVSIETHFDSQAGFFTEDAGGTLDVVRSDLNGNPRAGQGTWRLVSLKQPETTVPPADLPLLNPERANQQDDAYRTPGDALRPRWNPGYSHEAVLRSWPDGSERGKGRLTHDSQGRARIELPGLAAGPYRLHYESVDDFGTAYKTSKELIVAGQKTALALPALLIGERSSVRAGERARFLALSGLSEQVLYFEVWRSGVITQRTKLVSGRDAVLMEVPTGDADRGGFSVRLTALRDYQLMDLSSSVFVPWDNKELKVEFSSFRDKLRPGGKETWRVTVRSPSGAGVEAGAAEVLAYMYDRSLDIFAPHTPPGILSLYPGRTGLGRSTSTLGQSGAQYLVNRLFTAPDYPSLQGDRLKFYDSYGIGGPGRERYLFRAVGGVVGGDKEMSVRAAPAARMAAQMADSLSEATPPMELRGKSEDAGGGAAEAPEAPVLLRADFAETAFWRPQLLTGADGSASIEFTVPDSVTSWNVWVHAVTRDLQSASLHREARSVKDLMVRPYLPRFLREGDRAEIKVVVNNASDRDVQGNVTFDILDPDTNESVLESFGIGRNEAARPFTVSAAGGTNLTFPVHAPVRVGLVAFKVTAVSEDNSDGELRPLPVLPGRTHLMQSRFVTLKDAARREMTFEDLKRGGDPTRINEQMVVTLDAQLFYSVLSALPYLANYPYECTEQTLNRFVSAGILSSLYQQYPAVARMAAEFSKRDTRLETWDAADPNRKMALEETPWLVQAQGGKDPESGMSNVLDPRITTAEREAALARLRKAQTAIGGFPWWPGGPPSPYMTLYIMYGFAKAAEFGVDIPRDMVQRGWAYLAQHFRQEYLSKLSREDCCWEFLTFLNYAVSCYPDPSWTGDALTTEERRDILNHSFKHWKQHSPYLKCQLALTLKRMGRAEDAALVFASVMDSAKTTRDEGTFWAPEERAWLWYNDTIETHAFALRTLLEIAPGDAKKDGLVQWIFLNKKLNHWKSTRATAEVVYSLVHYLNNEGTLGAREDATVRVGNQTVQYVFEPDRYTGKKNQTVIPGEKVDAGSATVVVQKESKGLIFASATWHFSTERLPEEGSGDLLSVSRTYFQRRHQGGEFVLTPLAEGAAIAPGDEIEVQLSIRAKHPCEYVHLRDPRAAGLEPENAVSRFKWNLGIGWYEETRDSGTNFFFDWLPQGEYTFKYRLRANMGGTFKVGPSTLQSMYAPEFSAYSAGAVITVK